MQRKINLVKSVNGDFVFESTNYTKTGLPSKVSTSSLTHRELSIVEYFHRNDHKTVEHKREKCNNKLLIVTSLVFAEATITLGLYSMQVCGFFNK